MKIELTIDELTCLVSALRFYVECKPREMIARAIIKLVSLELEELERLQWCRRCGCAITVPISPMIEVPYCRCNGKLDAKQLAACPYCDAPFFMKENLILSIPHREDCREA